MKTKICLMFVLLLGYAWVAADSISVTNFSFEQPGAGKIKTWDGTTDIPGWKNDTAAADSGVESDWPGYTDGIYSGYMMAGDPSAWNLTDHVIAAGEVFTLQVDARDNWTGNGGLADLQIGLYYDVAGVRTTVATATFTDISQTWTTYSLVFSTNSVPASIGNKIGIELKNVDPATSDSWMGMDNVRLSVSFVDVVIPADGAQNVAIDTNLQWTVANGWNVDVYLSGPYAEPNSTPALTKVVSNQAVTSYDPTLVNDRWYYWHVDAHEPNIPNDIIHIGPTWSFKTVPANAGISAVSPALTVVAAGNAVLTATGVSVTSYQWYKMGSPDVPLTESTKYAGVTTDTLTITDVQQADEGYYYCIGSNAVPSSASNRDTGPGRVMIKRLTSHYPMEVINVVDSNDVTPDTVSGLTMTLKGEGTAGFATLAAGVTELGGNGLLFNNSDTDPNGQYAQIGTGVVNYTDITIELWCKWNGGANWQRIYDFGNDTNQYMFLTPSNGTEARFVLKNSGAEQIISTSPLSTGQWVHVAATLSGNTGRLYVNGELKGTNTGVTINPIDFKPTINYIAKSQYTADPEFDGTLDDMKIYNYARTSMEIAQDYTAVKGGWVCNMEGTASMKYDLDKNCRVDLADFAIFAATWLDSNRINAQ